ncbi:MAG: rRNA maturation RNase YbeY [Bacteroidales bacterium]|nr:rRNA maturation RNase YbeY [Bacteroidales bacterium]MDD4711736.1 rRNA maturation RNase YbeY [Bacteroidales bacterium]
MIRYYSEDCDLPGIDQDIITDWINRVAVSHGEKAGEINYIFCSDARILEVNNQYLHHDYYTDIITFDYSEQAKISGDIYIGIETVESNARMLGISYESELKRVIIHGILHLCGFKDKTPETEAIMHQKEDEALKIHI